MILFRQCIQDRPGKTTFIGTGLPPQYSDGSLIDAQRLIRDHQILVKLHLIAQSKTVWTGTKWVIEGEAPRLHLVDADAAVRAGKILAEIQHLPVGHIHHHQAVSQIHGSLDGIGQTLLDTRADNQTVYHNLNVVLDVLVQMDLFGKLILVPIDPHPDKTALFRLV